MLNDPAIEALRLEIGSDFEVWAHKMDAAFQRRIAEGAWPERVTQPARPTGWDDAGLWLNAVYWMMWTAPSQEELQLVMVAEDLVRQAWLDSTQRLVNDLLDLGVLDPNFRDLHARQVIDDGEASSQVTEDGDEGLIRGFDRLRNSKRTPGIRNASGAVEDTVLNLFGVVDGVLATYVVAALSRLRVSNRRAATFVLTPDEAAAFAEMHASNRATDDLVLISQECTTTYERPRRRTWHHQHTTWTHVFVGPELEYTIELEMQPKQEIPRLVRVSTKTSPPDRYVGLVTTGRHRWVPERYDREIP